MNSQEKQQEVKKNSSEKSRGDQLNKVQFSKLAQGANEVLVEHEGQVYRLRLTRNGKLILNK